MTRPPVVVHCGVREAREGAATQTQVLLPSEGVPKGGPCWVPRDGGGGCVQDGGWVGEGPRGTEAATRAGGPSPLTKVDSSDTLPRATESRMAL